eukprot:10045079-Karenia_brevis.AAC.1
MADMFGPQMSIHRTWIQQLWVGNEYPDIWSHLQNATDYKGALFLVGHGLHYDIGRIIRNSDPNAFPEEATHTLDM